MISFKLNIILSVVSVHLLILQYHVCSFLSVEFYFSCIKPLQVRSRKRYLNLEKKIHFTFNNVNDYNSEIGTEVSIVNLQKAIGLTKVYCGTLINVNIKGICGYISNDSRRKEVLLMYWQIQLGGSLYPLGAISFIFMQNPGTATVTRDSSISGNEGR